MFQTLLLTQFAQNTMWKRVKKAALIGFGVAFVFCVWVTLIRINKGEQAFVEQGITYPGTIVMYVIAGVTSGAIIGALLPMAQSRVGAYAIGFAGGLPIVAGILIQQRGLPSRWSDEVITLAPVLVLVATIVIGSEIRRRGVRRPEG
jgi:hypothetical protein